MEETLSTLDYAIRAKSIRNRPEINQRMTRNALLKEYVAEIECLKADLLAAREKNGIFFSEDTWNQMNVEQELTRTALEETKRQVEIVARQLNNVQEEYQESMNLLTKRDGELKEAKQELSETTNVLTTTSDELQTTKRALDEEVVVRESHQTTEATLDEVARGLKHTTQESLADLSAMFAKLCTNVSMKFTLRKLKILYSAEDHSAQCECRNRPQLWKGFNLRDAETLGGNGRFHQKHYARPGEAAHRRRSIPS